MCEALYLSSLNERGQKCYAAGVRFKRLLAKIAERCRETETVPGRVVFLGTLHPKVDVEALTAVAELPEVEEFVVTGDGPQREALEAAASAVEDLWVTGRLPDDGAFPLLASAAVAINPQHASDLQAASSSAKLYYYAALGRPMVLTKAPEFAETLAEAGAARLVGLEGAFADAVRQAIADRELRELMSRAARQVGERATWERRVASLSRTHAELL